MTNETNRDNIDFTNINLETPDTKKIEIEEYRLSS